MDWEEWAISLALSVGACVGGGWWCLWRLAQARFLLDTPTSKVRSAAQGYVELYGVLQQQPETLVGPLTGKPCVWWRFKIEEYSDSGKKRSWRTLESGASEARLRLADATGECLIDPLGAEVRPLTREVWTGNLRHPRGPLQGGGILGWLSSGSEYRYTEERLHAGEPLYAIGDFRTSGGGQQGLDLNAAQTAVIREWKGDFAGMLQRFDSDKNGQLDEPEWNRVRLAAQLEAEDRHKQTSLQPAQHLLARPRESQPFILSSHGEDHLARQFRWQAVGAGLLCLAGALATAYLLNNR